jgi:membrane protease YdiL (CAAX protease family)
MIELYNDDFSDNIQAIVVIGSLTLLWLFFHFFRHERLLGWIFSKRITPLKSQSVEMLSSKMGGLLWLGIAPLILFMWIYPVLNGSWFLMSSPKETAIWLLILIPVPIILARFVAKKPAHLAQYPQVREPVWNKKLLITDLLCWALYLLGYESFFRGVLLFGLAEVMSPWIAIMINVMVYSLVHIPKGRGEAIGAIPLGLLLCLITLTTGNFWVAFFVHLSMAWSNELFALKYHTEIVSPLNKRR